MRRPKTERKSVRLGAAQPHAFSLFSRGGEHREHMVLLFSEEHYTILPIANGKEFLKQRERRESVWVPNCFLPACS
jgi:hypothetical protein